MPKNLSRAKFTVWLFGLIFLTQISLPSLLFAVNQFTDDSPSAPRTQNFKGIAYKGVTLSLGGFLAAETVYRSHNMASDIVTSFANMPFPHAVGFHTSEFRGSERQSRFIFSANADISPTIHLQALYELDFLGAATNSNALETNSYAPRTRNIYLQADWELPGLSLLAGQNWSLTTLHLTGLGAQNEAIPATIDAQYAVGFTWARQWQIRLIKKLLQDTWLALSAENAQTLTATGLAPTADTTVYRLPFQSSTTTFGTGMSSLMSINDMPDFVLKIANDSWVHLEAQVLLRKFKDFYGPTAGPFATQSFWTTAIGAGAVLPFWLPGTQFRFSTLYGPGSPRYGTAQLADVTFGNSGQFLPLHGFQYLAQVFVKPLSSVELYVTFGQEKIYPQTSTTQGSATRVGVADGIDPIATGNQGCFADLSSASLSSGASAACQAFNKQLTQINVGLWWTAYEGDYGTFKVGAQGSHTRLDTFADASNIAPASQENMFYTSLRYYPF
jgi:hypothetical protein